MSTTTTLRRRAALTLAGTAGALALAAAPAGAAQVDLGGGATTLKLDAKAGRALTSLGVKVAPTGGAKAGAKGLAFPITGGRIDPASAAGTITHSGGLRLSAGKVKVTLSGFTVSTTGKTISAKVNGGQRLGAFVLRLTDAKVSRAGLATHVSGVDVHLSSGGAKALNATFHVSAFKPGLKLATASIAASPKTVAFTGGETDLALDPGAASALSSLGVKPGVAQGATLNADGSAGFPIASGEVDAKTLAGTIAHSGALTLTKGSTVVALSDFTIDTNAKTLSGKVNGGAPVALLNLDLASPQVAIAGRGVTVGNVGATLTQGAADALNGAFGTTAFTAGLKLGVATVRGQAA